MATDIEILSEYIRTELGYDGELSPDQDLLSEQILDSFSIVQIAVFIQERFGLEIDPADLVREKLATLSSMIGLIEKNRNP